MANHWIAMFSQTGGEIVSLIKAGYLPNLIITSLSQEALIKLPSYSVFKAKQISVISYFNNEESQFHEYCAKDSLITLHGYLKIIPKKICEEYRICNGHPGDIISYPELKGKNPQEKAIKLKLKSTGCVIHKVTEKVDSGEILIRKVINISSSDTEESLTKSLKKVMFKCWRQFFEKEKLEWYSHFQGFMEQEKQPPLMH